MQLTMLRNLPIASLADEAKIGTVADAVLHPDTGELVGFWVTPNGWFAKRKALSSRDIISYDPQALVVRTDDALVEAHEVQPFASIVSRRETWIGKRAQTEDGKHLGNVSDLVINTDLEMLAKLEVTSLLGPELLIAREDIIKVGPKTITVRSSYELTERIPAAAEVTS